MKSKLYLKLIFSVTVFSILSILLNTIADAQQSDIRQSDRQLQSAAKTTNVGKEFLKFDVELKDRFYLGETPIIKLSWTNMDGGQKRVLEAEHRKFHLRGEGIFNNASEYQVKKFDYDGSWLIDGQPKSSGDSNIWIAPQRKEATFTILKLGGETNIEADLSKWFSTELFTPGKYKIIAETDDGQEAVKEFEVYFDNEKSTPILEQKLRENGSGSSFYLLSQYNRLKLITVLEDLQQSNNQELRERATNLFEALKTIDEDQSKRRERQQK